MQSLKGLIVTDSMPWVCMPGTVVGTWEACPLPGVPQERGSRKERRSTARGQRASMLAPWGGRQRPSPAMGHLCQVSEAVPLLPLPFHLQPVLRQYSQPYAATHWGDRTGPSGLAP